VCNGGLQEEGFIKGETREKFQEAATRKSSKTEFLCLTKHHAMTMYGGLEVWFHAFLTSALDGVKWSGKRRNATGWKRNEEK
jgi:hypothetical protein